MKKIDSSSLLRELLGGPKTASELAQALHLSQPGFSRLFKSLTPSTHVRTFGSGRATLYAAERRVADLHPPFPLIRIDEAGHCHDMGELSAIENRGYIWSTPTGKIEAFLGIPFFLSDARPQGYLGRSFAKRHEDLGFPARIPDWSEDQIFAALALRGEHLPGNLIVGKDSFARYQSENGFSPLSLRTRANEYEKRATGFHQDSAHGSSAAGEQPKFPAYLEDGRHVLVKFSPKVETPKGRRWADLLISEFHAIETIDLELKIPVAKTKLIEGKNRVFLESTRFDRIGPKGRRGCISFASLEAEWVGSPSVWSASAKTFLNQKKISGEDAQKIQTLDAFGALIANSDRHYGNLSFFFEPGAPKAILAPVYDMLPMFFAPRESEDPPFERNWKKPMPTPDMLKVWAEAESAAELFWKKIIKDPRISHDFKSEAKRSLEKLK